jgi:hypothetical protein
MLRSLKMHGMAQAVGELTEQGSPAFEAALPILSALAARTCRRGCVSGDLGEPCPPWSRRPPSARARSFGGSAAESSRSPTAPTESA